MNAGRLEAKCGALDVDDASDEQGSADEQHGSDGHLAHDEQAPEPIAVRRSRKSERAGLQSFIRWLPLSFEGADQAEYATKERSHSECGGERRAVQTSAIQLVKVGRTCPRHDFDCEPPEQHAAGRTAHTQDKAFGHELPKQTSTSSAEGR